ncbi:MAG: UPF0182 family protein, partial [Candidatus Methylomirabilales bacterium]
RYTIDGSPRQVLLSTREMDTGALESTNWQNTHLFYTHGYGAVVSAASEATVEGEPNFLVQDIPPKPDSPELALTEPGIYFGEGLLGVYSLAPSAQKELDFAREAEQGNKLTSYAGRGGVPASGVLRRLAFAWRFRNINLAISGLITPESRILYYRQVRERLLKAAPFLHFDTDPYPVISDGRIVWVADGYTVSDMYPYSERLDFGDRTFRPTSYGPIAGIDGEFNYVRNSVKATVDAYDGTVSFYVWDPTDPIIRTWRRAFPALFKDAEDMPTSLRSHVRYPEDLFRIQTYIYQRYHMTEPTDFFTREDLWVIPADPNQSNEGVAEVQDDEIQPYYVLMRLPGAPSEEYALILPMNPRGKRNMISWLAAKSGPADYGRLIDFRFPKGSQIDGVGQAHARINNTPEISKTVSLLDVRGSKVQWGNLLVIPVKNSVLYVQPMFVQAEKNAIPELKNVILVSSEKVVMGNDLRHALGLLLAGGEAAPPGESAEPGETARPPVGPGSRQEAARLALEHLRAAREAAQRGDWATYGRELQEAERRLGEALGEPGQSTPPRP